MDFLSDRDRLDAGEFREEIAWQRGMDFAVAIYRLTDGWPRVDPLELTMDIRRNAVSLPGIVARGFGIGERDALLECLQIVLDTARQLDAQLSLSVRVGYSDSELVTSFRNELSGIAQEVEALQRRFQTF